jgi:hypothetical protein
MYNNIYNYNYININNIDRYLLDCVNRDLGINTETQKTGYGYKSFFVCPECGASRVKLYYQDGEYLCRKCLKLNYPRQQMYDEDITNVITRTQVLILYKLGVPSKDIGDMLSRIATFPSTYNSDGTQFMLLINKPKGMHYKTYLKYLKRLDHLEKARVSFILLKDTYSWRVYKAFVRDGLL